MNTFGCETNCHESSTDCCKNSTDCCTNSTNCCQTTSNCCQRISNCCNTCSVRCQTPTCTNQCKRDCCISKHEDDDKTEKVTDNGSKQTIIEGKGDSNSNNNKNDFNLSASINLNNTINSENRIYIPINISNTNVNSVVITSSGVAPSPITTARPDEHTTSFTTPSVVTTPCPTHTIKVPVPVPVPGPTAPVPTPYPIFYPLPQPNPGCCIVVNPCASHGCHSYQRTCGFECSHQLMYRPIDPCEGQCHKRPYVFNRHCHESGYCSHTFTNCAQCDADFYLNYENYQQCGRCFYR